MSKEEGGAEWAGRQTGASHHGASHKSHTSVKFVFVKFFNFVCDFIFPREGKWNAGDS